MLMYTPRCESCIDRIYTIGPGPCPVCGVILRKNQFKPQTYENLGVEKEVAIRMRIAKMYARRQMHENVRLMIFGAASTNRKKTFLISTHTTTTWRR